MINVNLSSKHVYESISSLKMPKILKTKKINIVLGMLLIVSMVLSSVGPALQTLVNQDTNGKTNQSQKDNNLLKNEPKGAQNALSTKIVKSSVTTTQSKTATNVKSNQQQDTATNNPNISKKSTSKTISGINTNSQIRMNETFDSLSGASGSTTNSYASTTNTSTLNLDSISGYTKNSGSFNLSNLQASTHYNSIQSNKANATEYDTNSQYQNGIAGSFNVTEGLVNISSVRLWFYPANGQPQGEIYITGITSNLPNNTILSPIVSINALNGNKLAWTTVPFPKNVTLPNGNYAIILNQTNNRALGYWGVFITKDSTTGVNNDKVWTFNNQTNVWTPDTYSILPSDLLFGYQYQVLNPSNASQLKSYTSPQELDMKYDGTPVTSLNNWPLSITQSTANFTTNASVTFDMTYKIKYTNITNYLVATTEYFATNSTNQDWNVTLFHNQINNQGINIINRLITFYSIPTDWSAVAIDYNTSNVWTTNPDGGGTITYTNNTSYLIINASSSLSAYNWTLEFLSPNYIQSYTATSSLYGILVQPFNIYSNDTLQIDSSMSGVPDGGNGTLQIYDPYDLTVFSNSSKGSVSNVVTFDSWLLSSTINKTTNQNGTYIGTLFWISTNQSQIGFFEFNFTVTIVTKLIAPSQLTVIRNDLANVSLTYENGMNKTNLIGATVSYYTDANWGLSGQFSGYSNNYNISLATASANIGYHWIYINASLPGYVTITANVTITVVINTALLVTYPSSTYYYDVVNITVGYTDKTSLDNITGATIQFNNTNPSTYVGSNSGSISSSNSTYYLFNTSYFTNPNFTSFTFIINASKTFYYNASQTITITLNPTPTTTNSFGSTPPNGGTISKDFAYNSADLITLYINYFDSRHSLIVHSASLSTNTSSTDFTVTGTGTNQDQSNGTWIVTLNPLKIGTYGINLTFTQPGYVAVSYIISITVNQSPTQLLIGGSYAWSNNTSPQFIFNSGSLDTFTINLTLKDTFYNQNVTTSLISGNLSTNSLIGVVYSQNSATGAWNIAINPLQQTTFTLKYTLYLSGYANETFYMTIIMDQIPTAIQNTSGGTWTNQTINTVYQDGSLDNITYTFIYNDTYWNQLVTGATVSTNQSVTGLTLTNTSSPSIGQWLFTINPNAVGTYTLVYTFSESTYQTITLKITIVVSPAPLRIVNYSNVPYTNSSSSVYFDSGSLDTLTFNFWLKNNGTNTYTNYYYGTNVTTFSGANVLDNTSITTYMSSTRTVNADGTFTYTFNPLVSGTYVLIWTFSKANYQSFQILIVVTVIATPTNVYYPNGTTVYTNNSYSRVFNEGQLANLTFSLTFKDTHWDQTLSTGASVSYPAFVITDNGSLYTVYVTTTGNGTWSVYINPLQLGTYYFNMTFSKASYTGTQISFKITTSAAPTQVYSSGTTPYTTPTLSASFDQYQNDSNTYYFSYFDTYRSLYLPNGVISVSNTSYYTVILTNLGNGHWSIFVNPLTNSSQLITIQLSQYGYATQTIYIQLAITQTPTSIVSTNFAINNGTSVTFANTTIHEVFSPGTGNEINFGFASYDTVWNGIVISSLAPPTINDTTVLSYQAVDVNGNFSLTIIPLKVGSASITFTLYRSGYANVSVTVILLISQAGTTVYILNPNPTHNLDNKTIIDYYSSDSKAVIDLHLQYYDLSTNTTLINATLTASNVNFNIAGTGFNNTDINGIWNVSLTPLNTGTYQVTFNFTKSGYETVLLTLTITVNQTPTNVTGSAVTPTNSYTLNNNTSANLTTTYDLTSMDNISLTLTFRDSYYNELINNSMLTVDSSGGYLVFNNITNKWYFSINGLSGYFTNTTSNTWQFFIDPTSQGNYSLVFNFTKTYYVPFVLTVNIHVSKAEIKLINSGSSLTNTTSYSVYYSNGSYDLQTVNIGIQNNAYSTNITSLGNLTVLFSGNLTKYTTPTFTSATGSITYTFDPELLGAYNLTFVVFDANHNYVNYTVTIFYIVQANSFNVVNSSSQTWSDATTFNRNFNQNQKDNVTFEFTVKDNTYGNVLTLAVPSSSNNSDYILIFTNKSNGLWSVFINPLKSGTFTITIQISEYGYNTKTIQFTILIATTQTDPLYGGVITWVDGTTFAPVYNNTQPANSNIVLYITSNDTAYNEFVNTVFTNLDTSSVYYSISATELNNYTWVITITPLRAGDTTFSFTLTSIGYTPIAITVKLHILMPTQPITFQYTQGLVGKYTNGTTRLGYSLQVDANWDIYNNSQVQDFAIAIYKNGTLINGATAGITVLPGDSNWTTKLLFVIMPDFNFVKGWYQFNITFSKYGYINRTLSFLVYVRGFNYKIGITHDPTLTQGATYNVYATITYDNGTSFKASQLLLFKLVGSGTYAQSTFNPVNSLNVNFQVHATFTNGTSGIISSSELTTAKGLATFAIPGSVTKHIRSITSISASLANSTLNDNTVNSVSGLNIKIQEVQPFNPLFIAIPVIIVIILFLFGIFFFRRRSKKNARIKAIFRGNMAKVDLPNSVYSIMLTTNTGLPVLTRINAVYSKSKAVEELISGLSVGIDTFLSSFQSDFMSKLGTVDQTKVDPSNPHKVFMSAIKRNEFHVLIIASPGYRGFVFLKDAPSSFAEQTFFKMVEQVQANVQIDVVFDEDEVKADVGKQINKLFPFKLLDKFVLNAEKIVEAENNAKLSKPAAEALMRVFAITTGAVNINETPQKQVAQFHKVLRKNAAFSGASDSMDAIKSGVLFYNTIYNMMQKQLKIPAEVMVEALWDANLKNLGIYELVR